MRVGVHGSFNEYNNEVIFYTFSIYMYSRQKMESIKEGAYFDYFKFFSLNAAETIRKLETTFKDEISEDMFFDAGHMFRRVKTLLSSYEVLLMEIKDSCEFVEIPEFGVCIMKIFFQLMSIIKFMGKSIILRSGIEKGIGDTSKRADQRHTMISSSPTEFYQNSVKSANTPQTQERQNFRMKEMASHMFSDIRQEMANIQKEHKIDSLENDRTFEKINKGREKLQEIESSQSQAVLSETVNMLYKKSQHINNFINIVQTNISLQSKENCLETYLKIKEQFDEDCQPRFLDAKEKLNKLFREHVTKYESKKRSLMVNAECQAKLEEEEVEEKAKASFHSNKKSIHNSGEQVKKLRSEVRSLQEENKTLKIFIQEKCEQYQNLITKLRSQKISMECKSNNDNKSVVAEKFKSSSIKKSESYIQNIECTDNISEAPSHFSVQSQNKEVLHNFESPYPNKRSKVNLASNRLNRSKVKFHFNDKQLALCSKVLTWVITLEGIEVVPKEEKKKQKINQTQFQQIEERPSEHQTSFRDISAQMSQTLLKNSKFKAKRQRTSLMIYSQFKDSKEAMLHTDSGFSKSRKPFHPLCSIATKKLMKRKESTQNREEVVQQLSSGQTSKSQKRAGKQGKQGSGKVSIFMLMEKQNEKRFSGNNDRTDSRPIISIEPVLLEAKRPKYTKFMEGIQMIELQSVISFERPDLLTLFFNDENASNYELLNLTLLTKNNQFFTAFQNKNIVIKEISKSATNSYKNLSPKYRQKEEGVSMADIMTNIIFKYLKVLRQSKKDIFQRNYHIIKNFIRFPYSSVYRKKEKGWRQNETQNNAIQFLQLKKCIWRIFNLHASCKAVAPSNSDQSVTPSFSDKNNGEDLLCEHWHQFVNRIGLHLLENSQ